MAEYIEREALLKRLDMAIDCKNCPRCVDMKTYYDRCAYTDIQDVCGVISDMPAADVQPVKRGRWVAQLNGHVFCTFCGKEQKFSADFCKHCGADMREPETTKG